MARMAGVWLMVVTALAAALAGRGAAQVTEPTQKPSFSISPKEVTVKAGTSTTLNLTLSEEVGECVNVTFELTKGILELPPPETFCADDLSRAIILNTTTNGKATITITSSSDLVETEDAFCVVSAMKAKGYDTTGDVLGWMYTIAWDISFLPQIVHNWRRHSVVGLSFDFLTFNFLGFLCYFLFNMGMLWIGVIKDQYESRNPHSVLHVRLNDVIFPLYALVCTALQIAQCFFYEREENQRISIPCRVITGLLLLVALIGCILVPAVDTWWWIDYLYMLSYIKLAITCIKYIPQLWENYRHRSTEGWSIWQVILDFAGGSLSLIQMFLLAANYDDWMSVLKDPAKLGLGLLSIGFNILFFIQHYILYRNAPVRKLSISSGNKDEEKKEKSGIDAPDGVFVTSENL